MKFKGTVQAKTTEEGVSKAGKDWYKLNIHVREDKQDCVFSFFGDRSKQAQAIEVGEEVEVDFYLTTRTYN